MASPLTDPVVDRTDFQHFTREELQWDLPAASGKDHRRQLEQPWRSYWPPKDFSAKSAAELEANPWLTWKRDPFNINDKPWYRWIDVMGAQLDVKCNKYCPHCGGQGCVSHQE
jgi:hypothetical protein